ncbi:hypothetical protein NEMBOFW57_002565 [Staphylotrichum longicolle]|uniref:Dolichyl-diphosphooligosaccharide--protein glycosyltransferase subunit OST2 n=1 Tax=Staphylotrichum longicolle TaxID=669026 RepID=A0AAD4I3S0_9PEZI|nr:hypothetical protein NEMBOFW57_002565 [Staphylotrichum longicolle]
MAPKQRNTAAAQAAAARPVAAAPPPAAAPIPAATTATTHNINRRTPTVRAQATHHHLQVHRRCQRRPDLGQDLQQRAAALPRHTPQRTKLLDAFMAFLVAVGALQFLYCILAGNYTTEANKGDFPSVSPERAFADYVVCSLILHFFCVNFIN